MEKKKFEKEAEVAASLWKENVGPSTKQNNGDFFQSFLMSMLSSYGSLTEEQKQHFEEVLKAKIIEEMNRMGRVTLSVDYGPCMMLAESADEAGIDYSMFPCKTTMWISDGKVSVSHGYRADVKDLYVKKDPPQPGS